MANECVFCKIVKKEIKSDIVYEDEKIIAFYDIDPKAPIHILIVPKEHIPTLNDVKDFSIFSDLIRVATELAKEKNISKSGYKILANCGKDAGQAVFHIHFHLLGGMKMEYLPV